MSKQKKTNNTLWILIAVLGAVVIAGVIYSVINKQAPENGYIEQTEAVAAADVADNTLGAIIKSAQSWGVAFKPWFGKTVPEFTITDIKGQEHSLSGYRGRNVLVVFWATWCPACNLEIPHLIELRKEIGEEELTIIALSNEDPGILKAFVNDKGINYSVASVANTKLPSPFAEVSSIPTTFFIDPNGKIKLVAVGLVELDDTKAILKAEG